MLGASALHKVTQPSTLKTLPSYYCYHLALELEPHISVDGKGQQQQTQFQKGKIIIQFWLKMMECDYLRLNDDFQNSTEKGWVWWDTGGQWRKENSEDTDEYSLDHDFNAPFCVYSTAIKLKDEEAEEEEEEEEEKQEEGDGDDKISVLTENF